MTLSKHADRRAYDRGITEKQIHLAIQKGKRKQQRGAMHRVILFYLQASEWGVYALLRTIHALR
jgi:hypothetical protein